MTICSRKAMIISSIACGCVILILGITAAVLGAKGYFTFHDPCIGVETFEITDMDLETAEDNSILGFLDSFTGGLASELVPTQATMTIKMVLEVNNTNPYDLEYEQKEEGVIEMPADEEDNHVEDDLVVGTWTVPSATLKGKARNEIPVNVRTQLDLLSGDAAGLAGDFVTGQPMVFRVRGGIEGTSWLPGFRGHSDFICLANVDNILDLETGARVKCTHSTKVGNIIDKNGDLEFAALAVFEDDDEVDPACIV